jgi:hypothetical protein
MDSDRAGAVVVADNRADVAAVVGLHPVADGQVRGCVLRPCDLIGDEAGVAADDPGGFGFDAPAPLSGLFEVAERDRVGELVDVVGVGIAGEGEELGAGPFEALGELGREVVGLLAGQGDAGVVVGELGVDLVEFGAGEDEPVGLSAPGEAGVAGFAVEAVEADADDKVPGATLGAGGGEGVGVVEVPGRDVVGANDGVAVAEVEADHEAFRSAVDDGAGFAVEQLGGGAVEGGLLVGVVAQQHAVADRVVAARPAQRWPGGQVALIDKSSADGTVEGVGGGGGTGVEHRPQSVVLGREVAVDRGVGEVRGVVDGDDAVMGAVCVDSFGDLTVA